MLDVLAAHKSINIHEALRASAVQSLNRPVMGASAKKD
jgi:hypothetical protein